MKMFLCEGPFCIFESDNRGPAISGTHEISGTPHIFLGLAIDDCPLYGSQSISLCPSNCPPNVKADRQGEKSGSIESQMHADAITTPVSKSGFDYSCRRRSRFRNHEGIDDCPTLFTFDERTSLI